MINIFKETDRRLEKILSIWEELSLLERETLIETYWNVALYEKNKIKELNDNIYTKHTIYLPHIHYLYYNSFLALNLYIKHKEDWSILKDDMKEISLLLWRLSKGQYAYSLFKHIGKDSRERKVILNGFHNNKLNMKECTMCKKKINGSNYRQHYMKCYRVYAKEGNRLKDNRR